MIDANTFDEEEEEVQEKEPQPDRGHPRALAAQRLLADETVQDFFRELIDQFGVAAIFQEDINVRNMARERVLALTALREHLEAFARGEIPKELESILKH